jgi:adenylosuccinate synthase
MPNETEIKLVNTDEEINVTNPWQEHLRIGELDYDLIDYALTVDNGYHRDSYRRNMVITCLDQRPDWKLDTTRLPYYIQGVYTNASPQADSWVLAK